MVQIHPPLPFLLTKLSGTKLRRIFEHTADAGIEARAETLSEAFNETSLAFTEIVTGGKLPSNKVLFEFHLESTDLDSLLVNYVSHLIFLFDTENFLVSSAEIDIKTGDCNILHGKLYGDLYDETKHGYGVEVKAVSYHMLEIIVGPPSRIIVILDL
tara:strand:+ start:19 stop:489 length:471 start_codon:yes stop_codon:yes gene_type:complete